MKKIIISVSLLLLVFSGCEGWFVPYEKKVVTFEGYVTDTMDDPIANLYVDLSNPGMGGPDGVITDVDGWYSISYEVDCSQYIRVYFTDLICTQYRTHSFYLDCDSPRRQDITLDLSCP